MTQQRYIFAPDVFIVAAPVYFGFSTPFNPRTTTPESAEQDPMAALVEYAGRMCYMSQENPSGKATPEYIANIIEQGHGSVLEHANLSLMFAGVSRSLTHELVRHRAGFAYSQLSQRYVSAAETAFVVPPAVLGNETLQAIWRSSVDASLDAYTRLLQELEKDQGDEATKKTVREAARSVLPNSTETKIVVTANARAWRHFLEMRGSLGADAEIRRLACHVLRALTAASPSLFQGYEVAVDESNPVYQHYITCTMRSKV